jgi:hypothetical protein
MKKKYKYQNGKFVERKAKFSVFTLLTILVVLVVAALIYVNV